MHSACTEATCTGNKLAFTNEVDGRYGRGMNTISRRRFLKITGLGLGAAGLATIVPWTIRNAVVYQRFIPLDTGGAYSLWAFYEPHEEFDEIKQHTVFGRRLLAGVSTELFALAAEAAWSHHEWWDGSGYPNGLAGKAIPLSGRIVAIADIDSVLPESERLGTWKRCSFMEA